MDTDLYPFQNLKEFFAFNYMLSKTDYTQDINLIRTTFNTLFYKNYSNEFIATFVSKFFPNIANQV